MSIISWIQLNIVKPQLTGQSKGGLPLIEAALEIADTNNKEAFDLDGVTLKVLAPESTPVQISWFLPKTPINKGTRLVEFTGINIEGPKKGIPANQEFPVAILSSAKMNKAEFKKGQDLNVPGGPALTVLDQNIAPKGVKGPFTYEYSIVFLGSDGNYYLWDPPIRNVQDQP